MLPGIVGRPNSPVAQHDAAAPDTPARAGPSTSADVATTLVREGSPRATRMDRGVSRPEQADMLRLQAENESLKRENRKLKALLWGPTRTAAHYTPARTQTPAVAGAATSTVKEGGPRDTGKNSDVLPADEGPSANNALLGSVRAEHPDKVHADFSEEWEGVFWTAAPKKDDYLVDDDEGGAIAAEQPNMVFFKSRALRAPECALRMMIADEAGDKKQITEIFEEPPHLTKPGFARLMEWLKTEPRIGTWELLYDVCNEERSHEASQAENRTIENQLVSEMAQLMANGTFNRFLFVRGKFPQECMLVHAVDALAGTFTYRGIPSSVCATGKPFRQARTPWGTLEDQFENWFLIGFKTSPKSGAEINTTAVPRN